MISQIVVTTCHWSMLRYHAKPCCSHRLTHVFHSQSNFVKLSCSPIPSEPWVLTSGAESGKSLHPAAWLREWLHLFQAGSGLAKEHGPWKSEIDILPKTKQNPSGPGDAQHTLFSPMPSYRWSFVAAARIRQRLPSGLLGLTRRKLGAMTSRAEKLTWHISRCRHIRTDNIFGLRNLGRSTNLTTCANLATSCEAAVAPFWLEASQVRSWWALLRDCNETDHPLDQWNPMKSHLFGQVSTVQLQISGIELDIFFAP